MVHWKTEERKGSMGWRLVLDEAHARQHLSPSALLAFL